MSETENEYNTAHSRHSREKNIFSRKMAETAAGNAIPDSFPLFFWALLTEFFVQELRRLLPLLLTALLP